MSSTSRSYLLTSLSLAATIALVSAGNAEAGAITTQRNEIGDAEALPEFAQVIGGIGGAKISSISGLIESPTDVDMYLINILDPTHFSANTTGTRFDTQLFLFRRFSSLSTEAFGVCANDDVKKNVFTSSLKANDCRIAANQAGQYYLAISGYNIDPVSEDGFIFDDPPFNPDGSLGTFGPNEDGGARPVSAWAGNTSEGFIKEAYKMILEGAFTITSVGGGNGPPPPLDGSGDVGGKDECDLLSPGEREFCEQGNSGLPRCADVQDNIESVFCIPEPSSLALVGSVLGLLFYGSRRKTPCIKA